MFRNMHIILSALSRVVDLAYTFPVSLLYTLNLFLFGNFRIFSGIIIHYDNADRGPTDGAGTAVTAAAVAAESLPPRIIMKRTNPISAMIIISLDCFVYVSILIFTFNNTSGPVILALTFACLFHAKILRVVLAYCQQTIPPYCWPTIHKAYIF